jgi:hypothetical protein
MGHFSKGADMFAVAESGSGSISMLAMQWCFPLFLQQAGRLFWRFEDRASSGALRNEQNVTSNRTAAKRRIRVYGTSVQEKRVL